jgi:16S rRNA (guanine527-N7)-methyltransferase
MNPAADRVARQFADLAGRSPDSLAQDLDRLVDLLLRWNRAHNLVSRETEGGVWRRHVEDSLQLLNHIPPAACRFLDVGSGGGFPALPLAIAFRGGARTLAMVEPAHKKAAFLRTAIREFDLAARVHQSRLEEIDSRETLPDVITSRALAALPQLATMLAPHWQPQTVALLHKGREHSIELAQTRLAWDFDVLIYPSSTDETGVLLEIRNLRRISGT